MEAGTVNVDDIESDVLTESEDETAEPQPQLGTPFKSPRMDGTLDAFSPLSNWDGRSHDSSHFGFAEFNPGKREGKNRSRNEINEEEHEESGGDDDNDDLEEEDGNSDDNKSFDEDEDYKRFLRSVRWNGDENGDEHMDESFLFDEHYDEDDYYPEEVSDESSGSDDGSDDGLDVVDNSEVNAPSEGMQVKRKELAGLLGDCWLTIAGDNVDSFNVDSSLNGSRINKSSSSNANILQSNSLLSSLMTQFFTGNKTSEPSFDGFPITIYRKILARQMSMAIQLLLHILIQSEDRSHAFSTIYPSLLQLHNHRVNAVKKAALLQANMEAFLAAKQQQEQSSHLQNLQYQQQSDSRVLKLNQIQALMEEVAPHLVQRHNDDTNADRNTSSPSADQQLLTRNNQNYPMFRNSRFTNDTSGIVYSSHKATPTDSQQPQHRVMTRSSLINYDSHSRRSSSVLDIPILSNLNDLLNNIDQAQKRYKAHVLQFAIVNNMATFYNNQFFLSDRAAQDKTYRQFLLQSSAMQLEEVYRSMPGTKLWKSLIPTSNYPFSESFWLCLDPSSIVGKTFFTPAEEDLLVRGILKYGDSPISAQHSVDFNGMVQLLPGHDPWVLIQQEYFPNRAVSSLQYHYQQKTSASMPSVLDAALLASSSGSYTLGMNGRGMFDIVQNQNLGNNIFKRFQWIRSKGWLVNKRPHERRWQHIEDINLLRGFQVLGEDWNLLTRIFLPHRPIKDARSRWKAFLTLWQKTFPNFEQRARQLIEQDPSLVGSNQFDPDRALLESLLSPKLQAFLQDVQECSSFRSLLALKESGQGRHMEIYNKLGILSSQLQLPMIAQGSIGSNNTYNNSSNGFLVPRLPASWLQQTPSGNVIDGPLSNSDKSLRGDASLFPSMSTPFGMEPTTRGSNTSSLLESTGFPSVSFTSTSPTTVNMGNMPPQHYAALTRVHDVFDFDHTQWGDISCDELSDEDVSDRRRNENASRAKKTKLSSQARSTSNAQQPITDFESSKGNLHGHNFVAMSNNANNSTSATKLAQLVTAVGASYIAANYPYGNIRQVYPSAAVTSSLAPPPIPFLQNANNSLLGMQPVQNAFAVQLPPQTPSYLSPTTYDPMSGHKRILTTTASQPSSHNSASLNASTVAAAAALVAAKRQKTDAAGLYVPKTVSEANSVQQQQQNYFQPEMTASETSPLNGRVPVDATPQLATQQTAAVDREMEDSISSQVPSELISSESITHSHMGIEDLFSFSNITRDMSRIRADILAEEQVTEMQDSAEGKTKSLSQSSGDEQAKASDTASGRGLFASVMRGAT